MIEVKCNKCKDIISYKGKRGLAWCSCESVAVDYGDHYYRILGYPNDYCVMNSEHEEQ